MNSHHHNKSRKLLSPVAGAHRPAPSPSPTSSRRRRPLPRPHLRLQGPPRGLAFPACVAGLPHWQGMDAHSLVRASGGADTPLNPITDELLFLFFVDTIEHGPAEQPPLQSAIRGVRPAQRPARRSRDRRSTSRTRQARKSLQPWCTRRGRVGLLRRCGPGRAVPFL
jgi:hypothetical protein